MKSVNVSLNMEELRFIAEVLSRMPNSSNSFGLYTRFSDLVKENSEESESSVPEAKVIE